jgi:hypothetical protein
VWSWQFAPGLLKVIDDLLNNFAKLLIDFDRIVPMNACDQIGSLADINLVLVAPLNPSMVIVDRFHLSTSSIAHFACFARYKTMR